MAESYAISGLKRRREEIAREIRKLSTDLTHIDAAIKIMQPQYKPKSVRHGVLTRSIFAVLREAAAPLTVAEIADKVKAESRQVKDALLEQRYKGLVKGTAKSGELIRWEIVQDYPA